MITNVLEYGANQFTPGVVKSLSQENKIDQVYLKKVIAASKGELTKEAPKEMKINLALKKGGSRGKGKPSDAAGKVQMDQVDDKLMNLKLDGYDDDEAADKDVKIAKDMM
jgi:hypothetical protein